jgi:hypothetical protein
MWRGFVFIIIGIALITEVFLQVTIDRPIGSEFVLFIALGFIVLACKEAGW